MPVTNYIYDPVTEAYLMEQDGDGNTTVVYTQEPVKYGDVIAQHRIDPATGVGRSYYYHTDALGSTRELTDSNGDVVATYNYDAFGNTIASTGTVENPFRFTGNVGYYWDEELQTYHIRARNYQPTIGRWTSQDPIGFAGGSNLYGAYFVPFGADPTGHWVNCSLGYLYDTHLRKLPIPFAEDTGNNGVIVSYMDVPGICGRFNATYTCIPIGVTVSQIDLVPGGCGMGGNDEMLVATCDGGSDCPLRQDCFGKIPFAYSTLPRVGFVPVISWVGLGFPVCLKTIATVCVGRVTGEMGVCNTSNCPPPPPLPIDIPPPVKNPNDISEF